MSVANLRVCYPKYIHIYIQIYKYQLAAKVSDKWYCCDNGSWLFCGLCGERGVCGEWPYILIVSCRWSGECSGSHAESLQWHLGRNTVPSFCNRVLKALRLRLCECDGRRHRQAINARRIKARSVAAVLCRLAGGAGAGSADRAAGAAVKVPIGVAVSVAIRVAIRVAAVATSFAYCRGVCCVRWIHRRIFGICSARFSLLQQQILFKWIR